MALTLSAEDMASIAMTFHGKQVVYYVTKLGNDSNDGLTPATAKLTCAAAQTAAPSGAEIIVGPGTWNENNLGKDGVDWFLSLGAVFNYTGTNRNPVFGDAGAAKRYSIRGRGRIINACASAVSGTGDSAALSLSAASTVLVEADELGSESSVSPNPCGIVLGHSGANIVAKIKNRVYASAYDAIVAPAGRLHLEVPLLESIVDGAAIEIGGPSHVFIDADILRSATGEVAVDAIGDESDSGILVIRSRLITNTGSGTCVNAEGHNVIIEGARIKSSCIATGGNGRLRLIDVDAGAITISAGGEVVANYGTRTGTVTGGTIVRVPDKAVFAR